MSLRIFDVEGFKPHDTTQNFSSDTVAYIKGGYQEDGRPVASPTLVFTSDDPEVAQALTTAFGGELEELEVEKGHPYRLISESKAVDLLLDKPEALSARFAMYGQAGLIFATDGETVTEGESFTGEQVGDRWSTRPESIAAWKDQAGKGRAPKPDIKLRGKLADNPDLGYLQYRTSGWSLVNDLHSIENQLATAFEDAEEGHLVRVTLKFEEVSFVAKNGPRKGQTVSYTRPYIKVHGA